MNVSVVVKNCETAVRFFIDSLLDSYHKRDSKETERYFNQLLACLLTARFQFSIFSPQNQMFDRMYRCAARNYSMDWRCYETSEVS